MAARLCCASGHAAILKQTGRSSQPCIVLGAAYGAELEGGCGRYMFVLSSARSFLWLTGVSEGVLACMAFRRCSEEFLRKCGCLRILRRSELLRRCAVAARSCSCSSRRACNASFISSPRSHNKSSLKYCWKASPIMASGLNLFLSNSSSVTCITVFSPPPYQPFSGSPNFALLIFALIAVANLGMSHHGAVGWRREPFGHVTDSTQTPHSSKGHLAPASESAACANQRLSRSVRRNDNHVDEHAKCRVSGESGAVSSPDRFRLQPYDLKSSHAHGNPIRAISDRVEADSTYGTDPNRPDSVTEDTRGSLAYSIMGSVESPRLTEESLDSSQLFDLRSMPPLDEPDCVMDEEFTDDADVPENTSQYDAPPAQLTEYELVRQLILSGEQEVMRMVMDAYREMVGQHCAFQDDLPLTEDSFTDLGSEYSSERDPSDVGEGQVERSSRGTPNTRQSQRLSQAANPKRGRLPYDRNEEDGEGGSKRHKSITISGPAGRNGRRFACHYSKKYPGDSRLRRSCIHGGFDTVHRVKEHIFRTHILPTQCSECFQTFDNDRGLTAHHVRGECPRSGTQTELGVARGEQEAMELRRRQERQTSEEEKWNAVWRILFRGDEEIPEPYYEPPFIRSHSPDFESITNYERAVQTHLPRRVQDRITAQWPNIAEALIRQLPSIIRSEQASIASNYPGVRDFFVDRPEDTEAATLDVPVNIENPLVGASPYGYPNMLPQAPVSHITHQGHSGLSFGGSGSRNNGSSYHTSEYWTQPSDAATSDPEAGLRSAPETEQSSVASAGMETGYYHSPHVNATQSMVPQMCPPERLASGQDSHFVPRGLPHRMPANDNHRNNMQFRQPPAMGNLNANLPNYGFMSSPENAVIGATPAAFSTGPFLNPTQFGGMPTESMGPPAYTVSDFSNLDFGGWKDPLLETMAQANNNNSPSDFSGAGTSPNQQQ